MLIEQRQWFGVEYGLIDGEQRSATCPASAVGGWIHAIGLETDTPNTTVTHNVISGFTSPSTNQVAVWFEGLNGVYQNVPRQPEQPRCRQRSQGIYVDSATPANGNVDGTCNWWGSTTGPGSIATGSGSECERQGWLHTMASFDQPAGCLHRHQSGTEIDCNSPCRDIDFGNQQRRRRRDFGAFTVHSDATSELHHTVMTWQSADHHWHRHLDALQFRIDADDCIGPDVGPGRRTAPSTSPLIRPRQAPRRRR